jgi:hypothetical protein
LERKGIEVDQLIHALKGSVTSTPYLNHGVLEPGQIWVTASSNRGSYFSMAVRKKVLNGENCWVLLYVVRN